MFARGRAQAVGDQHQGAIGQPRPPARGRSLEAVENVFKAQLLPNVTKRQKASPNGGLFGGGEPLGVDPAALAVEQPDEGVQLGAEPVLAAQADDDAPAAVALLVALTPQRLLQPQHDGAMVRALRLGQVVAVFHVLQ